MIIFRIFILSLPFPSPFFLPSPSTAVHLGNKILELLKLFAGALGALFKTENHPAIIHLALTPTHLGNLKAVYLVRGC